MSEWIKTSERKPPEGEQVWAWMGGWSKVERMYLRNDIWYHDTVTGGSTYGVVDAIEWWRPLPSPPGTAAAPSERPTTPLSRIDEIKLRKALERAWVLLDRGASREQAIGVIANALGTNEVPDAGAGEAELGRESLKLPVENCARCGDNHEVVFHSFREPVVIGEYSYQWWGMCPVLGEPIVMNFEEKKGGDDG